MPKPYFKNLNGLRFVAALLVFLDHSVMFKQALNPSLNHVTYEWFTKIGGYGVKFFFVLSGFLITYLLLQEIKETKTLNIKNFYIRRVLRIWPLYFLVGIGGTILGPILLSKLGIPADGGMLTNLGFLFLFSINLQLIFFEYNRGIVEILWSVCIEEQFYLIWAPLVKFLQKHVLTLSCLAILVGFLSPFFFDFLIATYNLKLNLHNYFFTTNAFTFFGMGSLGSYLLMKHKDFLASPLFGKIAQVLVFSFLFLLIFHFIPIAPDFKKYVLDLVTAALFLHVILTAIASNSILKLENPFFNTLGKISYGIYVYHTFVLQIGLRICYKIFPTPSFWMYELVFPFTALGITVIISYLSYQYFEKFFLRLKERF